MTAPWVFWPKRGLMSWLIYNIMTLLGDGKSKKELVGGSWKLVTEGVWLGVCIIPTCLLLSRLPWVLRLCHAVVFLHHALLHHRLKNRASDFRLKIWNPESNLSFSFKLFFLGITVIESLTTQLLIWEKKVTSCPLNDILLCVIFKICPFL